MGFLILGLFRVSPLEMGNTENFGSGDDFSPKASVSNLWAANGSLFCSEVDSQDNPKICSNGDDGAIIVWTDQRVEPTGGDIYAQRIHRTGSRQWAINGTAVCTEVNRQYNEQEIKKYISSELHR